MSTVRGPLTSLILIAAHRLQASSYLVALITNTKVQFPSPKKKDAHVRTPNA